MEDLIRDMFLFPDMRLMPLSVISSFLAGFFVQRVIKSAVLSFHMKVILCGAQVVLGMVVTGVAYIQMELSLGLLIQLMGTGGMYLNIRDFPKGKI